MRYLLISLIAILTVSCASYPKKNNFQASKSSLSSIVNPYFSDDSKDYIFKAGISFYNKKISGILIIKKLDETAHRVVFMTEMGNKIFDFSFLGDKLKIDFILDELDKKFIINTLKKDFNALTKENNLIVGVYSSKEKTVYETRIDNSDPYYFFTIDQRLSKIVRSKNGKENLILQFSEIDKKNANLIQIMHQDLKLTITLKAI